MDVLCILYFVQTAIVLSIKQEPSTFSVLGLPSFGLCECWLSLWVLLFFFSRDLYVNHLGCFCKIKCTTVLRWGGKNTNIVNITKKDENTFYYIMHRMWAWEPEEATTLLFLRRQNILGTTIQIWNCCTTSLKLSDNDNSSVMQTCPAPQPRGCAAAIILDVTMFCRSVPKLQHRQLKRKDKSQWD